MRNECGQGARPSSLKRSNLWLMAGKQEVDTYLMFDDVGNVEYDSQGCKIKMPFIFTHALTEHYRQNAEHNLIF